MNPDRPVAPIERVLGCKVVSNGDNIVIGLQVLQDDGKQDVDMVLPFNWLSALTTALLTCGDSAERERAKNPLHTDGTNFGFVLDLENLTVGPSHKKKGWHVLRFLVKGKNGQTHYLIGADRERIEMLRD